MSDRDVSGAKKQSRKRASGSSKSPEKASAGKALGIAEARSAGEAVLYRAPGGKVELNVQLERETVWLSLNQMSKLFGRDKSVISRHLGNVFESRELRRSAVVAKNATTAADGKTYYVEYFNLDAILSVGYRVNSKQGTQFRIWATRTLRDHLLRGYTLNERRLRERGLNEVELASLAERSQAKRKCPTKPRLSSARSSRSRPRY